MDGTVEFTSALAGKSVSLARTQGCPTNAYAAAR